jgi:hypothetical protein
MVTISANSDASMVLCYRATLATKQTCKKGSRIWRVKLHFSKPATTTYIFVLKNNARVVATKTIVVKVK